MSKMIRIPLAAAVLPVMLALTGCETLANLFSHNTYDYDLDEVREVDGERPADLWMYPAVSELASLEGPENAHGVLFPDIQGDVSHYDQESPLVLDWTLDGEGRILVVEAMDYESDMRVGETGIHKYWHIIPSAFRLYALDEESGSELWSTEMGGFRGGTVDWFPAGDGLMGMAFESFDLAGEPASFCCAVVNAETGGILLRYEESNALRSHSYLSGSDTILLEVVETNEDGERVALAWKGLDPAGGGLLWERPMELGEALERIGEDLYLVRTLGGVSPIDPRTGSLGRLTATGLIFWVSPVDDCLLLSGDSTMLLDPAAEELKWTADSVGGRPDSARSIGDRILLIRTETTYDEPPKRRGQSPHKKGDNPDVHRRYDHNRVEITAVDASNGDVSWVASLDDKITGAPVLFRERIVLTTPTDLVSLDPSTGAVTSSEPLPWDRPWLQGLQLIPFDDYLLLESDLLAAVWSPEDSFLRSHEFHPLWESVSSEALYYDVLAGFWILEKNMGVDFEPSTWVEAAAGLTGDWSDELDAAYAASNRNLIMTQNSMTQMWNSAELARYYGTSPGYITNLQQQMAALGSMVAWSSAVNKQATGMNFMNNRIAYPYIRHEVGRLTEMNAWPWIVRPVSAGNKNRVSAVEAFNMETGEVKRIVLGPRQATGVIDLNLDNGATGIGIFGGYFPYINFLPGNYRALIDWDKGLLFHYGPGFDESRRTEIPDSKNLRGAIFARPIGEVLE